MTDLVEIRNDILREMYQEAEPPLDFDHLLENTDEYPDDWYSHHVLDPDRQEEIIEKHVKKHGLTGNDRYAITMTCILNYGPRSTPK